MHIKKEDLTVVIVSYKSNQVIHNCIRSIENDIKIIIIDNANDLNLKKDIEEQHNNVKYILSNKNLGMGSGNNLGIKNVESDYVLILNPDVILEKNTISKLLEEAKLIKDFAIISPISIDLKYPNYKQIVDKNFNLNQPFRVKRVDGYSMMINLKRLKKFENFYFFDENFFLYLENDDLCKRLIDMKENIYIIPNSKIKHLGGMAVNKIYKDEIELSRNWHWIWSKFYFNKKHYGFLFAVVNGFPTFFSGLIKFTYYYLIKNNKLKKIYFNRVSGYLSALIGRKSTYRPKING